MRGAFATTLAEPEASGFAPGPGGRPSPSPGQGAASGMADAQENVPRP